MFNSLSFRKLSKDTGYKNICLVLDNNRTDQICTTRDWGFPGIQGCDKGLCDYANSEHISNFITWKVTPRNVTRVSLVFNHKFSIKITELTIYHQSKFNFYRWKPV